MLSPSRILLPSMMSKLPFCLRWILPSVVCLVSLVCFTSWLRLAYRAYSWALSPLLILISCTKVSTAKTFIEETTCHISCSLDDDRRSTQLLWSDFPNILVRTLFVVLHKTSDTSLQEGVFAQIFIFRLNGIQNSLGKVLYLCLNESNPLAAPTFYHVNHESALNHVWNVVAWTGVSSLVLLRFISNFLTIFLKGSPSKHQMKKCKKKVWKRNQAAIIWTV